MNGPRIDCGLDELVSYVGNGNMLAVPKSECGPAMAATYALVRRGVRDIHLIAVPTSGLQADILIGAGCVATVEGSGITLGEYGQAPCFGRFVREGQGSLKDSTCPAVYAGLQAAEKGIPFMPIRGLLGSDIFAHRDDYQSIANPFTADDPIVAVKAIRPDVALLHCPLADRQGNVWIERQGPLRLMAHAAEKTLVTVEAWYESNLLDDPLYGPATLSSLYITAIAEAKRGAWPLGLPDHYSEDAAHLEDYVRRAATPEGFADYLERVFAACPSAAE